MIRSTMPSRLRQLRTRVRDVAFLAGINLYQLACLRRAPRYVRNWREYERRRTSDRFPLRLNNALPFLSEFTSAAGTASGHYFHQDLWAARRIYQIRPARHVDIGSRVDGFVAHVLTFMPVTVVDVRSLDSRVPGLTFVQGDLVNLREFADGSVESLSCLHTVEHVGLGRYGDAVDPDGWLKAVRELSRVLKPGGRLYLSTPIGRERVRFNGDRIFAPGTILSSVPGLRLLSFHAVDEAGDLRLGVTPEEFANVTEACGLFEFTKDA